MSERWPSEPAKLDELEEDEEEEEELEELPAAEEEEGELPRLRTAEDEQHAYGDLDIPDDVNVLEGSPDGARPGIASRGLASHRAGPAGDPDGVRCGGPYPVSSRCLAPPRTRTRECPSSPGWASRGRRRWSAATARKTSPR